MLAMRKIILNYYNNLLLTISRQIVKREVNKKKEEIRDRIFKEN